jgi:DNA-binding CsgD family transcriptional regulator
VLIGREREVAAAMEAIEERRRIALVGDAGIGKTSVLNEIAARIARPMYLAPAMRTLAWRSYVGLEAVLRSSLPAGDHAAIAAIVERRVGDGVLVLDDLHWADADTCRLIPLFRPSLRLVSAYRADDPNATAARAILEEAGFGSVRIDALSHEASLELLRSRRPDLPIVTMHTIARRAAGIPLLLEELSRDGTPSATLRASVVARIEALPLRAREALHRLALLGRPAGADLVGDGIRQALAAGLVVTRGDAFEPRHALIADIAIGTLEDTQRRRLHTELANATADPGEAAVHERAAGHLDAARGHALAAAGRATHAGQRARLLEIAADAGDGSDGDDRLRVRAADALVEAGHHEAALRMTRAIRTSDIEIRAEACLYRARAVHTLEGNAAAEAAVREGLALLDGNPSPLERQLRVEDLTLSVWRWDTSSVIDKARMTLAATEGTDEERTAEWALGIALAIAGSAEGITHLARALGLARESGDIQGELTAGFHLGNAMKFVGRWDESLRIASEMRLRAAELGLRSREILFIWNEFITLLDGMGAFEHSIRLGLELLGDPAVPARLVNEIVGMAAVAMVELGRIDDARDLLKTQRPSEHALCPALALAEIELASGRPARAIEIVEATATTFDDDVNMPQLRVVEAWAQLDLGLPLTPGPGRSHPYNVGYHREIEAISALSAGDPAAAERAFNQAAERHHTMEFRAELRARWAAADAARRCGATERARDRLLELDAQAHALGMKRLLARVRTSLRELGIRRSSPRVAAVGGLTGREREVLALVAAGHRTREIAAILGVAPSSVESFVRSAMRKLDARTRIEAAQRFSQPA